MELIVRCGTVVSVACGRCRVEMDRERCAGCAGRCAAGLSLLGEVAIDVAVETGLPPVGERVSVGVPRRGMARAALVVFGLPVAGMAVLGAGAEMFGGGVTIAVAAGFLAGAAGALAWGRSGRLAAWMRPRLVSAGRG